MATGLRGLRLQLLVLLLERLVYGVLLIVLVPDRGELLLLLAVLVDLGLQLAYESLDRLLHLLHLRLLEVEILTLISLRLVLLNLIRLHREDAALQILQRGLIERDLLAAVALLLLELHGLLRGAATRLRSTTAHTSGHTHALKHAGADRGRHALLLWHRRHSLELVVDRLDDRSQTRVLRVPAAERRAHVLNGDRVKRLVRHGRHHMDLGRHLRELLAQRDLNVEGRRADRELERHTVLLVRLRLLVEERVGVLLAQLVDLDVSHRGV